MASSSPPRTTAPTAESTNGRETVTPVEPSPSPARASTGNCTVDGFEAIRPPDGWVAADVAVLATAPTRRSAAVVTYLAVQTTFCPGTMDAAAAGQSGVVTAPVPVNAPSTTPTSVRVTLPVLVTRNE